MGSGLHEWPLIIFTVLSQGVIGGFWVMSIALFTQQDIRKKSHIHLFMFFLWVLLAIAFIASTMHLGTPSRAMNALNRFGSSSLSNEIGYGSIFFAVAGIYWLLAIFDKMPVMLGHIWRIVAMILGIVFLYGMCKVYLIDTVPTWNSIYTPLNFTLTVFIFGMLLGYVLLLASGVRGGAMKVMPILSIIAFLVSLASVFCQANALSNIHSSVQSASTLLPNFSILMVLRLVLIVIGFIFWGCPRKHQHNPSYLLLVLAIIFIFAGEFIGRDVFYGLHMTVGMAVSA